MKRNRCSFGAVVGPPRLELETFAVSRQRSNQLSYGPLVQTNNSGEQAADSSPTVPCQGSQCNDLQPISLRTGESKSLTTAAIERNWCSFGAADPEYVRKRLELLSARNRCRSEQFNALHKIFQIRLWIEDQFKEELLIDREIAALEAQG